MNPAAAVAAGLGGLRRGGIGGVSGRWPELNTIDDDVAVRRTLCSRALKNRLVTRRFGARRAARLRIVPRWPQLRWPG